MELKKVQISPEIKMFYLDIEPNEELVKKTSLIFSGSFEPFKKMHRHEVYLLEHEDEVYYAKRFFATSIG